MIIFSCKLLNIFSNDNTKYVNIPSLRLLGGFCLVVEFHWGGSATNVADPSSAQSLTLYLDFSLLSVANKSIGLLGSVSQLPSFIFNPVPELKYRLKSR